MLTITVFREELYDERTEMFLGGGGFDLDLEHSLVSLSKWESKFEKPFLVDTPKSTEEVLVYIKSMALTPFVPEEVYSALSEENYREINNYIESPQSGTTIYEEPSGSRDRTTITSELIYYWMTVFHIPFECENWHLNRLFTLIRICNVKQAGPKKMSRREVAERQRRLNAQRRQRMNSTG